MSCHWVFQKHCSDQFPGTMVGKWEGAVVYQILLESGVIVHSGSNPPAAGTVQKLRLSLPCPYGAHP